MTISQLQLQLEESIVQLSHPPNQTWSRMAALASSAKMRTLRGCENTAPSNESKQAMELPIPSRYILMKSQFICKWIKDQKGIRVFF